MDINEPKLIYEEYTKSGSRALTYCSSDVVHRQIASQCKERGIVFLPGPGFSFPPCRTYSRWMGILTQTRINLGQRSAHAGARRSLL